MSKLYTQPNFSYIWWKHQKKEGAYQCKCCCKCSYEFNNTCLRNRMENNRFVITFSEYPSVQSSQ